MNNGSASGLSVLAGSIATESASVRPSGLDRSSGTSTVAHCAADASLAKRHSCNATYRVTALSPQAPSNKTSSDRAQGRRWIAHGIQADHFIMRGMVAEAGQAPRGPETRAAPRIFPVDTPQPRSYTPPSQSLFSCHVEASARARHRHRFQRQTDLRGIPASRHLAVVAGTAFGNCGGIAATR